MASIATASIYGMECETNHSCFFRDAVGKLFNSPCVILLKSNYHSTNPLHIYITRAQHTTSLSRSQQSTPS